MNTTNEYYIKAYAALRFGKPVSLVADLLKNIDDLTVSRDFHAKEAAEARKERDTAIERSLELLSKLGEVRGGLDSVKQERDYLLGERDSLRIENTHLKAGLSKPCTTVADDIEAKRNGFSECCGGRAKTRDELRAEIAELCKPSEPQPHDLWLQDRIDDLSNAINDHTGASEYGPHLSVWAEELSMVSDMLDLYNEAMEEGGVE